MFSFLFQYTCTFQAADPLPTETQALPKRQSMLALPLLRAGATKPSLNNALGQLGDMLKIERCVSLSAPDVK